MKTQPIKFLADGTQLEPGSDRTDHIAVLHPEAGLMVYVMSLTAANGDYLKNAAACEAACRELRALGHGDWQLATRPEWERHVLDLTRHNPAVDPTLYPGIKPRWHCTSTAVAGSRSSVWYVDAHGGYVGGDDRGDSYGFALAVRRVGQ